MAFAHINKVANKYKHAPKEAYEANQAKLPTLRILSYINNIKGAELENILPIQTPNQIALSLRASTKAVDDKRAEKRQTIQKTFTQKTMRNNYETNANLLNTLTDS